MCVKARLSRSVEVRILCQSIGVCNTAFTSFFVLVWVFLVFAGSNLWAVGHWRRLRACKHLKTAYALYKGFVGVIYWFMELQVVGDWEPILGKCIRPYEAMHYKAIRFIRGLIGFVRRYGTI